MRNTLAELEAQIRIAQGDADPDEDACTCEEHADGFYQCASCRAWIAEKLRDERERLRLVKDVPESEVPF